ncbi:Major facilitator superfamily domain [Phytophthora cactorum]|nr:Major facilitator superfamily domain [Phytophthora cactorum]
MMANCLFMIAGAVIQAAAANISIFTVGRFRRHRGGWFDGRHSWNHWRDLSAAPPQQTGSVFPDLHHAWASVRCHHLLLCQHKYRVEVHRGVSYLLAPFVLVESPAWLLMAGKPLVAEHELARLFGQENVSSEDLDEARRGGGTPSWSGHHYMIFGCRWLLWLRMLPSPRLRGIILTGFDSTAFGSYRLAGAQQLTGVNAVFFYSSGIFKQAGLSDSRIGVLLVNFVNVLPTLFCGMLSARLGNRKLILYGFTGMFLQCSRHDGSSCCTLVTTFGSSLGPLAWGIMADLFPDDIRAMGCSICVGCSWLCSLAIGLGYPYIAAAFNNYSFVPFMCTVTVAFLFVHSFVPETYGKTIQEIQDEFDARRLKKTRDREQWLGAEMQDSANYEVANSPIKGGAAPVNAFDEANKAAARLIKPKTSCTPLHCCHGCSRSRAMNLSQYNDTDECNARPWPKTRASCSWPLEAGVDVRRERMDLRRHGGLAVLRPLQRQVWPQEGPHGQLYLHDRRWCGAGVRVEHLDFRSGPSHRRYFVGTATAPSALHQRAVAAAHAQHARPGPADLHDHRYFGAGYLLFLRQHELGLALLAAFPVVLAVDAGGAKQVIARLYGEEHVQTALSWLEVSKKPENAEEGLAAPKQESMFNPRYRMQLLGGILLSCAQQLSGINAVFYYSGSIFSDAGISDSRVGTLIIDFINIFPAFFTGVLANRFGARNMILWGLSGMVVMSIGMTVAFIVDVSALSIVFTALYVIVFGVTLGPLVWVMTADIFPDSIRASASSLCIGINWLCNLIVGVSYPYISDALDDYATFRCGAAGDLLPAVFEAGTGDVGQVGRGDPGRVRLASR